MTFEAVDQKLFNQVMEKLIAALDKLTRPIEVTKKKK